MKTKKLLPVLMMMFIISWSIKSTAVIYHHYLGNLTNAEFVNICAGVNDSIVLHKPAISHTNSRWMAPGASNPIWGDTVIVTYAIQGDWRFSSAEAGNSIYVYFIENPPYQPACFAKKDTVFAYGSSINWALDAQNLTLGYSCTYLWDNGATTKKRTITAVGTYWVRITNQCGTRTDTLNVTIATAAGLEYGKKNISYTIYPNPASEQITLSLNATEVQLINMLGQVVLTEHNVKTLDISSVPKGLYIIQVDGDGNSITQQKIIIN